MIRTALLSRWHVHADDYADQAENHPDVSIVTIWDDDEERGKAWAHDLGVSFEGNLPKVMADPDIDAVIVTSSTDQHKDIILQAVRHKKHVFTEKVLALTKEDHEEIENSIERNHIKFMISLPRLTSSYHLYTRKIIEEHKLGDINMLRCRVAHNGAVPTEKHPEGWLPERFFDKHTCGGGSLVDLGAHPIYMANSLAGSPIAVSARLHSMMKRGVDDHSTAIVEYDSGVLAVLESSFVSSGSPFQLEIYGTKGTIMVEGDQLKIKSQSHGMEEWTYPEPPSPLSSPFDQWVEDILNDIPPSITIKDAEALTVVNEAAAKSHLKGQRITI
ncbi:Gfo/Idh/MocA family protein [Halobacillus litoralis]|uniref:Gfo/Idh/MocA family protein n=1 Tax=Halobacillus litoralis TaxID=45668 RepID=UPI001CFF40E4|nr:Gfo/Idh/MocA family oxidoreductase [Halobacillus litoralis]